MTDTRTNSTSRWLSLSLYALAAAVLGLAAFAVAAYWRLSHFSVDYHYAFWMDGAGKAVVGLSITAILAAAAFAGVALAAKAPNRLALHAVRLSFWVGYFFLSFYIYLVVRAINIITDTPLKVGEVTLDPPAAFYLKIRYNAPALGLLLAMIAVHLLTWRKSVRRFYDPTAPSLRPLARDAQSGLELNYAGFSPGDRVRISGKHNPAFGGTMWASFITHVMIIFVVPWLITSRGCTAEAYPMPGGGGGGGGGKPPAQVQVKVAKKKPVRKKKYVFRPNSAISFHTPSLDDSKVVAEVEQVTENQYQASKNIDGTGNGEGGFGSGGGKGGGWPGGAAGAPIRFMRLQYNGLKWNDGFADGTRADENFLEELHNASHLKVQLPGEAVTVDRLRNFKKGAQPPFLFMTGEAGIDMSDAEIKVIRQYLMDGGLLFADCGSAEWHGPFVAWTRRLFPEQHLLDISNDDPIFHSWFDFPNGAPPLWHHGGSRALGIKLDGRWAVFYFPGDLNDAWKSGHTGSDETAWKQSYQLGINVVKYAFDHYSAMNQPKKK